MWQDKLRDYWTQDQHLTYNGPYKFVVDLEHQQLKKKRNSCFVYYYDRYYVTFAFNSEIGLCYFCIIY